MISAGEWVTATGNWVNDRTHGQQFKARFLKTSAPTSVEGIEKYLASGMIRGIGPVYAKKLLRAFGDKVFDVIEAEPDRLREVDGIGPIRAGRIRAAASGPGSELGALVDRSSLVARLIVISEPDTCEMSLPTCRNDPVPDLLGHHRLR